MSHTSGLYRPRSVSPTPQLLSSKKARIQSPENDVGVAGTEHASGHAGDLMETEASLQATNTVELSRKRGGKERSRKARRKPPPEFGSPEDVNLRDVFALLGEASISSLESEGECDAPLELYSEVELTVLDIGSNGESISLLPESYRPWAVLVPFALPGETIRTRIYRHSRLHSYGDLLEVITPNTGLRDNSLVRCRYFGACGGCQYQMIPYEQQLTFKKRVIQKAYATYSGLGLDQVPEVLPTIPSPKQYGYRTKITPHFNAPPKGKKVVDGSGSVQKEWELRIGFDQKGRRAVMDIEECPIATDVLNKGLKAVRVDVKQKISTYNRGATLLLRDSLVVPEKEVDIPIEKETASEYIIIETDDQHDQHRCITSHKATVRERVGDTLFEFSAGSFFQNNNSILEPLTSYVRDAVFSLPLLSSSEARDSESGSSNRKIPTHLVDTYCGSGLFSLTLSPHFSHIAGIEIDPAAIRAAQHNCTLNELSAPKHKFHAGKSEDIFASVLSSSEETFPPDDTVVVIDPPRKGCDESFIDQVVNFSPSILVYVSCNVHTQARDVGMLMRRMEAKGEGKFILESLRGFDLFPQTAHVESVAVLRRV